MRRAIIGLDARRGTHPGLLLQRYLGGHDPAARRALFDATMQSVRSESLNAVYAEAFARRASSFAHEHSHRLERFTTEGRLIVGLGSENVLETGLRLERTYGVPIIPGSALKGVASHYCHDVWGQRRNPSASEESRPFQHGGAYHSLLFGSSRSSGNADDRGVIAFHDAWIVPESLKAGALRLDVMTPHHLKWQTNEAPPTDFDSPTPVSFLSVAGIFEVRLSWVGPSATPPDQANANANAWTALAMTILREALGERGVGGKTSSGYGRLAPGERSANRALRQWPAPVKRAAPPKPGEKVEAQLLEERTKPGGWKAMHPPSGLSGVVQNTGAVPADKVAGDKLELIVAFANAREIAFRYPTPVDEARAQAGGKKQTNPRRDGRR